MRSIRIGCGSANDTDRPERAAAVLERGNVSYICFDNLAERTLAFAQQRKAADPRQGHNQLLRDRMRVLLKPAVEGGVKMLGNMGAANPERAGEVVLEEAALQGVEQIKVATIIGDDVLELVRSGEVKLDFWETGGGLDSLPGEIVSANVYLGAQPFLQALGEDADVIISGRCSDLSPYVAVLNHEFGWAPDNWDLQGAGGLVGHLLECGLYVTGGAYVDPAYGKLADGLDDLSLPIAEVREDGSGILTKVAGTGGLVTTDTTKEQILHEIHDPTKYMSPDVVIDVSQVQVRQVAKDEVEFWGARGRPATPTYKVLVGVAEGWIAEGEVSFVGPAAVEKAEIAAETLNKRLARLGVEFVDYRKDLIGVNSIHGPLSHRNGDPYEVRLRIAGRTASREEAQLMADEAQDFWFGPMGGGGVRTSMRQVLAMYSALIPKDRVPVHVVYQERSTRTVSV